MTILRFDSKISMYYLILIILLVVLVLYRNFVHSKINRALRAIHDDQIAAEVMGINLSFYKIVAFAAGAGLSGLAGALYASYIRFISPDSFTIGEAINILIMMVLGGMGTIVGPIIGAVGITYLLESMRFFKDYRLIIYGLTMFVMILYMPGGLVGAVKSARERLTMRWADRKQEPAKPLPARTYPTALLSCENLVIRFGGLVAINDVDLTVSKGEILGLIGPNGSGKTTLFNMITGIYKPASGKIQLDGRGITGKAGRRDSLRHRSHVSEYSLVHQHDGMGKRDGGKALPPARIHT